MPSHDTFTSIDFYRSGEDNKSQTKGKLHYFSSNHFCIFCCEKSVIISWKIHLNWMLIKYIGKGEVRSSLSYNDSDSNKQAQSDNGAKILFKVFKNVSE